MGPHAKVAGVLGIIMSITFLTLIFSFFGLIMLGTVLILEILLLANADELVVKGTI